MDLSNVFILRDLINFGGGQIEGRKKIHKIVYIIQQLANPFQPPYEFRWNYYGVYSEDLAGELSIGEFFGILRETPIMEYGYRTYAIEVADETNHSVIAGDERLKRLVAYLNSKEPRLLEVLSSIMFFENEGLKGEAINEKLYAYKGHLAEFFDEAYRVYEELKAMLTQ